MRGRVEGEKTLPMSINLTFCGAAGTVTGSAYWVVYPKGQFLVDSGLFQGTKTVKELNYGDFPFDPAKIDFVLLTHAHIDHSGLIPRLVKHGFTGPIYATTATRDLLSYMLPDSAYIQETEVDRLNRRNRQRGRPTVEPIYRRLDVERSLTQFRDVAYGEWMEVHSGIDVRYWNAGHILGAASIELTIRNGRRDQRNLRLLFSGDIGPEHKLFHADPDAPQDLDYIICESTYGSRQRPRVTTSRRRSLLSAELRRAFKRGGNVIIPAFAVERTQELLLDLAVIMREGTFPNARVFLDSPLAIRATSVFAKHLESLEDVTEDDISFGRSRFHFTETVDQSKAIARFKEGAIILAASGMCDAGRIRHHLKQHLPNRKSTVLLVGFQAKGTMGDLLSNGISRVRIHGEEVAVRAAVRSFDGYSAHADQRGLIDWIQKRGVPARGLFLTHGEDEARKQLRDELVAAGYPSRRILVPNLDDVFDLLGHGGPRKRPSSHRISDSVIGDYDWHNDYAQLALDIQQALNSAADDKQRNVIIRRLKQSLERS